MQASAAPALSLDFKGILLVGECGGLVARSTSAQQLFLQMEGGRLRIVGRIVLLVDAAMSGAAGRIATSAAGQVLRLL